MSLIQSNLVRKLCNYRNAVLCLQWKVIHDKQLLPFANKNLCMNSSDGDRTLRRKRHKDAIVQRNILTSNILSTKYFCTKEMDMKNDPETKALLKEIFSDFENEKSKKESRGAANESSMTSDSILSEEVIDSKEQSYGPEGSLDYSLDEARSTSIPLTRGTHGVFELDELVTLLQEQNGRDISVIEVPPEVNFAEYMVIVTAMSLRHLRSLSSRVKWIHKQKKGPGDQVLRVEGFETAPDWHAMDLGNIILHVFMPDTREHYDLESLWSNWGQPGQEVTEDDPYAIKSEDEFWTNLEAQKENTDKDQK